MLKLPSILIVSIALLIAGCGGGGGGGDEASSPLDEALHYLPADTPFAVAIDTDTDGEQYKAAGEIVERFGLGGRIEEQIEQALDAKPGDVERVEKALGNEFVVGSTDAGAFINQSSEEDTSFVGAIQASDAAALQDLLKEEENAKEDGEANGATLYRDDDGDSFAIKDDVLIVAGSRRELERALETREGDDRMTEEDFDAGTEGIAKDSLLRVYLDIERMLQASPDAKDALKSKWVGALRTAGIGLAFERDRVTVDFNVKTDSEDLTDADLPIAPGAASPEVVSRDGDVNVGLRDPEQLVQFAQATAKSIDPQGFTAFQVGKEEIERQLEIDLEKDFFGQMESGLSASIDLDGKFGVHADLKDPAAFERTLEKAAEVLPRLALSISDEKVGFAKPKPGEDFYAISTGGTNIVFGVVDGAFVLSNDPEIAGTLSSEGTRAVPGAEGALVLSADAEELGKLVFEEIQGSDDFGIVDRIKGAIGTRPLDELNGSVESSTEGLTGSFELTLD